MIDCIVGYHLNPWTCGIAKFNAILSRHLHVPVVGVQGVELSNYQRPLLSIKMSEFSAVDVGSVLSTPHLVGDLNGWDPANHDFDFALGSNGLWELSLQLDEGEYQY